MIEKNQLIEVSTGLEKIGDHLFSAVTVYNPLKLNKTAGEKGAKVRREYEVMKVFSGVVGLGFYYERTVQNRLKKTGGDPEAFTAEKSPFTYLDENGVFKLLNSDPSKLYMTYYPNIPVQVNPVRGYFVNGRLVARTVEELGAVELYGLPVAAFFPAGFDEVRESKKQTEAGLTVEEQIQYRGCSIENLYYLKSGKVWIDRRGELPPDALALIQ